MAKKKKKTGKLPTHRLGVIDTRTDKRSIVGAGWKNDDGSISIVLNPCIVISSGPHYILRLFPERDREMRIVADEADDAHPDVNHHDPDWHKWDGD